MQISRKSRADLPLCQKLLQNEGALSPPVGMPASPIDTTRLQYIPAIIARLPR